MHSVETNTRVYHFCKATIYQDVRSISGRVSGSPSVTGGQGPCVCGLWWYGIWGSGWHYGSRGNGAVQLSAWPSVHAEPVIVLTTSPWAKKYLIQNSRRLIIFRYTTWENNRLKSCVAKIAYYFSFFKVYTFV